MSAFNVGNLKLKERRDAKRLLLNGLMPGKMLLAKDRKPLSCRPIDVSANGLGILVAEQLKEDDGLIMVMSDGREFEFKIVWRKRDFSKLDLMRYGLICKDTKINLIDLFYQSGALSDNKS